MPRIPGIRRIVRLATGRRTVDTDIDDEIAFHLDATIEELVRRGASREAARHEALRRFGDLQATRDRLRTIDEGALRRRRLQERLDGLVLDLRLAVRGLARSPGLVAAVVLTLALGLGANATMFGIVDRLMLRPAAHVVQPERAGRIWVQRRIEGAGEFTNSYMGYAHFDAVRERTRAFSHLAAIATSEHTVGRGEGAQLLRIGEVTGEFFALLGARPLLGRFLGPADDVPGATEQVAVISWDTWQRRYGGASTVVGQPLVIDGRLFTVVGVAPRGFTGPELRAVGAWVTMAQAGYEQRMTPDWRTNFDWSWLQVIGRLAPGVTPARAELELTTAYRAAMTAPQHSERRRKAFGGANVLLGDLLEVRGPEGTMEAKVALWLAGVAGVVLLIACANVANLLLARALHREREVAVQLALGAASGRIVRQSLLESLLLALAGGAAALLVALVGGGAISRLLLPDLTWEQGPVDGRVLAATAIVIGVTTLLIALSPMLQARRTAVQEVLRGGGRGTTSRASRLRTTLTVAQAALSVLLLVGAGLFVRSLQRARGIELGFDAERVLFVAVETNAVGFTRERTHAFWREARERVAALPGVASASLAPTAPFASSWNNDLFVPGLDSIPNSEEPPYMHPATHDHLRTLGTPVRRGRDLTATDVAGSTPVAVVNEAMARSLWPGQDALGRCFRIGADTNPCVTIVGIAADARQGELGGAPERQFYVPLAQQEPTRTLHLFVRAAGEDARTLVPAVRRALQSVDAGIPYPDIEPIQSFIDPRLRPWRLGATLFSAFGLLALAVAAVGLYGVLAYDVAQRTRELGVRTALGARMRDVMWLVLRRGLAVAAGGTVIGLAAATFASKWVADLLFEVPARDPYTLAVVAGLLLVVAVVASVVPAWRAARVNPQVALRAE